MGFFDRKILLNNITSRARKLGIKMGDLESNAGVSPGYFSRLNKEDNKASPGIEVICSVAEQLNVLVDDLVSVDFSALTPTQEYLLSFMNKLIKDTQTDQVEWGCETRDEINNIDTDYNGNIPHPLLTWESYTDSYPGGEGDQVSRVLFRSYGYDYNTQAFGNWYNLRLKNGVFVYVMHVGMYRYTDRSHEIDDKEMWMWNPRSGRQFICSNKYQQPFSDKLDILYDEIEKAMQRPQIRRDLRYSIDAFMKNDFEDDPEPEPELPF